VNGQKVGVALDRTKSDKREQVERFYDLFWHNVEYILLQT
jgi:hypothetical protein